MCCSFGLYCGTAKACTVGLKGAEGMACKSEVRMARRLPGLRHALQWRPMIG